MWRRPGVNAATSFSLWVPKTTRWITITILAIIFFTFSHGTDHLCQSQLHQPLHYHHLQHQKLGSVALDAPEGYAHLWAKTRQAFRYVYHHHKVIIFNKNWHLHNRNTEYCAGWGRVVSEGGRWHLHNCGESQTTPAKQKSLRPHIFWSQIQALCRAGVLCICVVWGEFKLIVKQGYFSGGAGYVLSREAMIR